MNRFWIILACLALAGCVTAPTSAGTVKEAVAEPPCDPAKLPQKPAAYPADALTGREDLWVLGTTLWADRKARLAYLRPLEAYAEECARR